MIEYPKIAIIVARARNGVIGRDGDLPWRISSDLKFFKQTTMGKPILMGRKTWESLPGALPGRPNLVLSRNVDFHAPGAEVFSDWRRMIGRGFELAGEMNADEVAIIGGAGLYSLMMPYTFRLYITEVEADIDGDTVFPQISPDAWAHVKRTGVTQMSGDDYPYRISIYERKNKSLEMANVTTLQPKYTIGVTRAENGR